MNTSPGAAMCPRLRRGQIIARAILLALVTVVLAACSAARVVYNQGPKFAYWWLDAQVNLNEAQSAQADRDIDNFFAWHRTTELPRYVQRLTQWQSMALQNITPEQACAQFEALRASYERMVERSLAPFAALALTLTPEQLQHLKRHQGDGAQAFAKEFLEGDPAQRLADRLERTTDRYESLYGSLTTDQAGLIRQGLQQSPFDPRRTLDERLRRNNALLQTVRQAQAARGGVQTTAYTAEGARPVSEQAVVAVRTWSQQLLESPTPGYAEYSAQLIHHGCAMFAAVHNSTSAGQRAHAAQVLREYEADFRALAGQR